MYALAVISGLLITILGPTTTISARILSRRSPRLLLAISSTSTCLHKRGLASASCLYNSLRRPRGTSFTATSSSLRSPFLKQHSVRDGFPTPAARYDEKTVQWIGTTRRSPPRGQLFNVAAMDGRASNAAAIHHVHVVSTSKKMAKPSPAALDYLARVGCDIRASTNLSSAAKRVRFAEFALSADPGTGFRFAKLTPELEFIPGVFVDDLSGGRGNSFRKGDSCSLSTLIEVLDLS